MPGFARKAGGDDDDIRVAVASYEFDPTSFTSKAVDRAACARSSDLPCGYLQRCRRDDVRQFLRRDPMCRRRAHITGADDRNFTSSSHSYSSLLI
jgi:hypothetical protein